MPKYCTQCGNKLTENSNFCSKCGNKVIKITQPENNAVIAQNKNNTAINQPKNNVVATQPKNNTIINQPKNNTVITQPNSNTVNKKSDRSDINPFTGKKHFNIVDDDKFLDNSYVEYNNIISQSQLLDETPDGQIVSDVSLKLIDAVENHLLKIERSDYTENYYDWEFHLVSTDTVNAFCLPGGKIIVYSGLLSIADKEEYLAFILGHEMAHALLDHGRTKMSAHNAKNTATTVARIGSFGLGLLGLGEAASVVSTVTNVVDIGSEYLLIKPWGRDQEMEADKLGMMIIKWAGYDISKIPEFWQKMSEINSNKHDFFSTHPSDKKRIDAMNKLVLEISNQENFNNTPVI